MQNFVLAHLSNQLGRTSGSAAGVLQNKIRSGASAGSTDAAGWSALMLAVQAGDVESTRVLLEDGSDVRFQKNRSGQSALLWAHFWQIREIQDIFKSHGLVLTQQDTVGLQRLRSAVKKAKQQDDQVSMSALRLDKANLQSIGTTAVGRKDIDASFTDRMGDSKPTCVRKVSATFTATNQIESLQLWYSNGKWSKACAEGVANKEAHQFGNDPGVKHWWIGAEENGPLVTIRGVSSRTGGSLCSSLEFVTSKNKKCSFPQDPNPKGEPFEFHAPEGEHILELHFDGQGQCVDISTGPLAHRGIAGLRVLSAEDDEGSDEHASCGLENFLLGPLLDFWEKEWRNRWPRQTPKDLVQWKEGLPMKALVESAKLFTLNKVSGGCDISPTAIFAMHVHTLQSRIARDCNRALLGSNPRWRRLWRPYVRCLTAALEERSAHPSPVYRCLAVDAKDPRAPSVEQWLKEGNLRIGSEIRWPAFTSGTADLCMARCLALACDERREGDKASVIFKVMNSQAVSVAEVSDFPEQAEVVFHPDSTFIVRSFHKLTDFVLSRGMPTANSEWDINFEEVVPPQLSLEEACSERDLLIVVEQLPRDTPPTTIYFQGTCMRPTELRGMRLSQLVALYDKHKDWIHSTVYCNFAKRTRARNMYEVVEVIIKEDTKMSQSSYAELGPEQPVDYFVSHWWGEEFMNFIAALKNFARAVGEEDPSFWICSFANSQHRVDLGPSLAQSPFNLALSSASCKGVCMVLDSNLETLSRIWCLYEIMRTLQLHHSFDMATENGCLTRGSIDDPKLRADVDKLGQKLLNVTVLDAAASVEQDRVKIFREIDRVVGRQQIDICIQAFLAQRVQAVLAQTGSGLSGRLLLDLGLRQYQARRVAWLGRTEAHVAAQMWPTPGTQDPSKLSPSEVLAVDDRGRSPLHYAARYSPEALKVTESLLRLRADPAAADEDGAVPVHGAAAAGHPGVVQLLLESMEGKGAEAQLEAEDGFGYTALHWAALYSKDAVVALLLGRSSKEIQCKSTLGHTPLYCGVLGGCEKVVMQLLRARASVSDETSEGLTPLHEAAKSGSAVIMEELIARSAAVNTKAADSCTPLHWACLCNEEKAASVLLKHRAEPLAKDDYGMTPLHRAAQAGAASIIPLLLEAAQAPACISAPAGNGGTPIHFAARGGHLQTLDVLLETGASVNSKTDSGQTPLHWACAAGAESIVQPLLQRRADVESVDSRGQSVVDVASSSGLSHLLMGAMPET
eukprot:TRINITY_DN14351_c0_g3_i1.p1 TRINITY_DN14351_c0_g3~~TRINITY_DN14351_c0_g3_i1.p1  ORF type:complete len:1332 (+),score=258.53 TRINITY_DN14351_c0_g3_i1:260-3997(+)